MPDRETEAARRAWEARRRAGGHNTPPPPVTPRPPTTTRRPVTPPPPTTRQAPGVSIRHTSLPARGPAPRTITPSTASLGWQQADRWMRRRATTGIMVAAHFVLCVTAIMFLFGRYAWGRTVLFKVYNSGLGSTISAWNGNPVIHTATAWSNALPWGATDLFYVGLAAVCLLSYFFRVPGWIALPVAVVGTVYGILAGVSVTTFIIADWPATAGAVIIAWFVMHKAHRRAIRLS